MATTYKIAVIGRGYVGLPLSLEFADHYPVLGLISIHNVLISLITEKI